MIRRGVCEPSTRARRRRKRKSCEINADAPWQLCTVARESLALASFYEVDDFFFPFFFLSFLSDRSNAKILHFKIARDIIQRENKHLVCLPC